MRSLMLDDSLGSSSLELAPSPLYPLISGSNCRICSPDVDSTSSSLDHKSRFLRLPLLLLRMERRMVRHRKARQRRRPAQHPTPLHPLKLQLKRSPTTRQPLHQILASRKHVLRIITMAFHRTPSHTLPHFLSHPCKRHIRTFTPSLGPSTRIRMSFSHSRQDSASHRQLLPL